MGDCCGWMGGSFLVGLLAFVALLLGAIALVKYLRSGPK